MRGTPFMVRLQAGLLKPKNPRLGVDAAGRVEAVGRNVKEFRPGDEVFGNTRLGSLGEYVLAVEDKLVQKPKNCTFEEVAAVPVAAITALQALRDHGKIQPGQKVLINGASGGVGTFAVQIAKSFGAEVTGVCSTKNLDMVRSIGADHVIDYTQEDFTKPVQRYDLIIDNAANRSISEYKRALTPNGICVVVGYSLGLMLQLMVLGPWISKTGGKKMGLMLADTNNKDLNILKELLEEGKVEPVIDRRYPLSSAAEAIRYLEEGHARGKVVVTITENNQA
jgi:NADPH:quinone reductase-like Zn-dependent oxidoreductase